MVRQIVVDTNVLVSALRSRRGASFRLLSRVGTDPRFELNVSVALVLEYEDALKRPGLVPMRTEAIDDVLDYLCAVANHRPMFFLWRPALSDPADDLVLEAAVASGASIVVTHNIRDFAGAPRFGVRALTPREFLLDLES